MIGFPPQLMAYRKAIVLAAVAASAGFAGWTIQGWRKGRELAELQANHAQAEVRRTRAVGVEWQQATKGALDSLTLARQTLAHERAANQSRLATVQAAEPTGDEWACRKKPLPETYLETFRK